MVWIQQSRDMCSAIEALLLNWSTLVFVDRRQQIKAKSSSLERNRTSPAHGSYPSPSPGSDGYESVNALKRDSPSSHGSSSPPSTAPPLPPSRAPFPVKRQECLSPSRKSPKIALERYVSPYETVRICHQDSKGGDEPGGYSPSAGPEATGFQGGTAGVQPYTPPLRPPIPGSTGHGSPDEGQGTYQRSQVALSGVYDNFRLKNTPVALGEGSEAGESDSEADEQDAGASRGNLGNTAPASGGDSHVGPESPTFETDAGGMGCTSIQEAIQERRSLLEGTRTEGSVVLLSVQKKTEDAGKRLCDVVQWRVYCRASQTGHPEVSGGRWGWGGKGER